MSFAAESHPVINIYGCQSGCTWCAGRDRKRSEEHLVIVTKLSCLQAHRVFFFIFLCLAWCSCVAVNVSIQYNGGFLPDIILLTLCYYHYWGTRLNAMKCFFSLQPMIPPNFSLNNIACKVSHNLTMSSCTPIIARKCVESFLMNC